LGSIDATGLFQSLLLAQGGGAAGGGMDSFFTSMAIPLGVTLLLMYLLLMRPEQKKRKEMEKQLSAIKKNDHVLTIGGIYGTVVNAIPGSRFVSIRVDDGTGTKLKILRSAISQVGAVDEGDSDAKPGE
jgi:preprotein translocase subunit YajC